MPPKNFGAAEFVKYITPASKKGEICIRPAVRKNGFVKLHKEKRGFYKTRRA